MSINCVLTSDRTQFKNYFNEGITLPEHSSVALTKLSIDVPVLVQTSLTLPNIAAGDRGENALEVNIDGIQRQITWTDLFNAHQQYPDIGNISLAEQDLVENGFYNGTYPFWLNNRLYLSTDGQTYESRCPPMWMVARAIQSKYQFYNATDITEYKENFTGIPDDQTLSANYAGGLVNYTNSYIRSINPTEYKINIAYNPASRALNYVNTTPGNFIAADLLDFTFVANVLTSAATGNTNMACGNSIDPDINGGFVQAVPNVQVGGVTAFGISLVGKGNSANDIFQPVGRPTVADVTPVIDIGIEFSIEPTSGNHVYRIIDGQKKFVYYDGAADATVDLSITKPAIAMCRFDNDNDAFMIRGRRGNILNTGYEFHFDILMGNDGANINTFQKIHTATKILSQPAIQVVPIFISNSVAGNEFKSIRYVPTGTDTLAQGAQTFTNGYEFDTFSLGIGDSDDSDKPDYRDFWNGLGLNNHVSGAQGDPRDGGFNITYTGTPNNKVLSWKPSSKDDSQSGYLDTRYWIGETILSNIYRYDALNTYWEVDPTLSLANMPKYLDVYLLNHTNKNYTGSFISNQAFLGGSMEGEDRLVGTVPFDSDEINESKIVRLYYETFNPYYRPINNPSAYVTNEFIVEISYKDFRTNIKKFINNILGTVRMELNFIKGVKQNVKRITGLNELVPIV